MGRRERIAEKRRRRAEEEATRAAMWQNTDPLIWYDRNGRELTEHPLRDLWRGKSGFLVCAGPSLNTIDYRRLGERGICSLAINNVSGYIPVKAMTFSDPPTKFHHGVLFDPGILKFVPKPKLRQSIRVKVDGAFKKTEIQVRDLPSVFAYNRICEYRSEHFLSNVGATWGNNKHGVAKTGGPKTLNTMLLGFRLLHYLGVRRVFLIGVDFGMQGQERQQGNYAFGQAGSPGGNNNAYRVLSNWFNELKPTFDADGYEVYNCNPDSRLTVFPYVPFASALEDCRYPVPPEPFDLEGWYEESEDKQNKKGSDKFNPDSYSAPQGEAA